MRMKRPINLAVSYSQKDEAFEQEFEDYLLVLQQAPFISGPAKRQVPPGIDWSQVIDSQIAIKSFCCFSVQVSLLLAIVLVRNSTKYGRDAAWER